MASILYFIYHYLDSISQHILVNSELYIPIIRYIVFCKPLYTILTSILWYITAYLHNINYSSLFVIVAAKSVLNHLYAISVFSTTRELRLVSIESDMNDFVSIINYVRDNFNEYPEPNYAKT